LVPFLTSANIRSRCQEFELRPLTRSETVKLLKKACEAEGVQVEEELLKNIAKEVQGIPRDALIRLGALLNSEEAKQMAATLTQQEARSEH
jgi:DNA polymerase III gamma/tau subunit